MTTSLKREHFPIAVQESDLDVTWVPSDLYVRLADDVQGDAAPGLKRALASRRGRRRAGR